MWLVRAGGRLTGDLGSAPRSRFHSFRLESCERETLSLPAEPASLPRESQLPTRLSCLFSPSPVSRCARVPLPPVVGFGFLVLMPSR